MTIIPILKRELVVAARSGKLQAERAMFAFITLMLAVAAFVSVHRDPTVAESARLPRAAEAAFLAFVVLHVMFIVVAAYRGAAAIASEKDRRTLDFLLGTRLSNSEIIFGKLAACVILMLATLCAGLPQMLILEQLGAAEWPSILLLYAGILSTMLLVCALSLYVSVRSRTMPSAIGAALLLIFTWLIAPMAILTLMRAARISWPDWMTGFISLLAASSPIAVFKALAPGGAAWSALEYHLSWMIGLQSIGTCVFLAIAVRQLRSAYRTNLDGADEQRRHAVWRFRPRAPVTDNPILWRAMYTSRGSTLDKLFELALQASLLTLLAYATWHYAAPAFIEVWNHGYGTSQSMERPDLNFFAIFYTNRSSLVPADFARTQFNAFLRVVSLLLVIVVSSGVGSGIEADLMTERARETWMSLLATSLTGAEILRAKALAALWRMKGVAAVMVTLWCVGVLGGAIHPLGFVYTLIIVMAWSGFFLALGARNALRSKAMKPGANPMSFLFMSLPASGLLLLLLPTQFRSVLLGAGSSVFLVWMSLFSYRDIRDVALFSSPLRAYPPLQWMGIATGDGPWLVILTCVVGVVVPAVAGLSIWRGAVDNFDRDVGRPTRPE